VSEGAGNFLFLSRHRIRIGSGPTSESPILWKAGVLSPEVMWPERESEHMALSGAEVKTTSPSPWCDV
jgi:hypothetical protein